MGCDVHSDFASYTDPVTNKQVNAECVATPVAELGLEVKSVEIAKMCKDSCEDNIVDQRELDDPSLTAARCSVNTAVNTAPTASWACVGTVLATVVAFLTI